MSIDNGDGTFDNSNDSAGYTYDGFDYTGFSGGVDLVINGAGGDTDAWSQGEFVTQSIAGGAPNGSDSGGIAESLRSMWGWYNDPKNDKKASALTALFGGALAGIAKQKTEDKRSKAAQMSAEASMLNAQTNADVAARKDANANAKVDFGGLMGTPKYSDKLAVRRARNNAGLIGGIA